MMFGHSDRSRAPKGMTYEEQREWMIQRQLLDWGIRDPRVLHAMSVVPRERFVSEDYLDSAYYDGALPIGEGQTISQPYVVAHMSELLALRGDERVLEIGTGSGYQAAVLSLLAREVYSVERIASLAEKAQAVIEALGYGNAHFLVGDGSLGWPEHAPYDAVLVACAGPHVPPPLVEQLADGGRLIMPVGPRGLQDLVLVGKRNGEISEERRSPVAFVPLIGKHGW